MVLEPVEFISAKDTPPLPRKMTIPPLLLPSQQHAGVKAGLPGNCIHNVLIQTHYPLDRRTEISMVKLASSMESLAVRGRLATRMSGRHHAFQEGMQGFSGAHNGFIGTFAFVVSGTELQALRQVFVTVSERLWPGRNAAANEVGRVQLQTCLKSEPTMGLVAISNTLQSLI